MIKCVAHSPSPKMLRANLPTLQQKLPKNTVTLLPISGSDIYYTDGLAINYLYRLEINEGLYLKYSAYINTKEFVSCNLSKSEETTYYGNIVQDWLSASAANQTLTQTNQSNLSLTQSHT